MTPAGIKPATFGFVAQRLNHSATAVPHSFRGGLVNNILIKPGELGLISRFETLWFTLCTTGFNTENFQVLLTECMYVLCMDLKINNDYIPIQH